MAEKTKEQKLVEGMSKGIKIFEKLQYIALFILSLVLIVGVDIITADIGWEMIKDPTFYISNIFVCIALLMITFGTIYMYLDWFKDNNETYIVCRDKIVEFANGETNIPSILNRFLEALNRKRKINQYKFNIRIKLHRLENNRKWYAYLPIVRLFVKQKTIYSEEEMHLWNHGTEEEKAKSEYCRKRKMYEEQLDPKLIEKIIDNEMVAYDKVTSDTILSEYYNKQNKAAANDFITKDESGRIIRFRLPRLILSFGLVFLVTSLVLDGFKFNWLALITITTKILSIVWNTYTSYRYAKKHAVSVTLHDAIFRKSTIIEYEKWLVEEADKTMAQDKAEIEAKEAAAKKKREEDLASMEVVDNVEQKVPQEPPTIPEVIQLPLNTKEEPTV